jgi:hypothetical protein
MGCSDDWIDVFRENSDRCLVSRGTRGAAPGTVASYGLHQRGMT